MNILNLLLAFLGLLSVSLANGGRGHDKKCNEGSTMCITLGQPVVEVCDNGHYTRLWMCPADFWCSKSPEAHCAGMSAPSKQCSECDMTMHKCLKVSVLESGGRELRGFETDDYGRIATSTTTRRVLLIARISCASRVLNSAIWVESAIRSAS
tara:strand:+ start:440 stop:898 length:459 start_codon:yes stop_codon:yes gene_type:complete